MIKIKAKNNKGFTLVEAMFAVFILTLSITTLMTVVANSLFAARYAKDEITANYLAQEVVDYIRNDRDTTVFLKSSNTTDADWTTFWTRYSACSVASGGCSIDVFNNTINQNCTYSSTTPSCPFLYYNSAPTSNAYYNYDSTKGVKTSFQRKVIVTKNALNGDEIKVQVTVSWKNGGLNRSRLLETSLLRWQY